MDLENVINNHSKVFGDMPKGILPAPYHDHVIHFQMRSIPLNIRPYGYPYAQKNEIEHIVQENVRAWHHTT
jgi:hypothetical protein